MKIIARIISLCIGICVLLVPFDAYATGENVYWPQGPKVTSSSAIIMEANTGAILYEKNIHDKHYPASITKILTTLLAVENADLSETVTFSHDAVFKTEGTSIARDVGEEMSLEDTLYAVMLGSANECAYATAEHVGGDYDTFIQMMNKKARELGCQDSQFMNPHGLPDKDHYTSAYDMALISRAAIQNDTFRVITGTKKYVIPVTNKHDEESYLVNHNAMLTYYKTGRYIYESCIGGKTGYTTAAQHTLVTYAERNGMLLICVVMETSADGQYQDTTTLLDFCFDNYQMYRVSDFDTEYNVDDITNAMNFSIAKPYLSLDEHASIVLPKTADLSDVTSSVDETAATDEMAGMITYHYGERYVGQAPILITNNGVEEYPFHNSAVLEETEEKRVVEINYKIIAIVLFMVVLLIAMIVGLIYLKKNINLIRYAYAQKKKRKESEISFKGKSQHRRRLRRRLGMFRRR